MTIAPLDLILLLGFGQGTILSVLLWRSHWGSSLSNRLLSALIGLLALASLAVGIPVANQWVGLVLDLLPFIIVMPIGPLLFFYVRSVMEPTFRLGVAEKRHFYPVVLDFGSKLIGWVFIAGVFLSLLPLQDRLLWSGIMDQYDTYADIPRWISITVYLALTARFLQQQKQTAGNDPHKQHRLRWLQPFVRAFLAFQVIWLLFMIAYLVPAWRQAVFDQFGWYPIYIPIAGLIYWLGLRGYLWSRTEPETISRPSSADLDAETVECVSLALTQAMQTDRLFLDPELTVEKVGRHLNVPSRTISAVLNGHLQQNFNTFVNAYRIAEVRARLTNPANAHLTLTGIAFECGFNSQATFQRAFRQQMGVSPTEFLATQAKNNAQIRI